MILILGCIIHFFQLLFFWLVLWISLRYIDLLTIYVAVAGLMITWYALTTALCVCIELVRSVNLSQTHFINIIFEDPPSCMFTISYIIQCAYYGGCVFVFSCSACFLKWKQYREYKGHSSSAYHGYKSYSTLVLIKDQQQGGSKKTLSFFSKYLIT